MASYNYNYLSNAYNHLTNDYDSFTNDYDSFTGQFNNFNKNPYSYSASPSKELLAILRKIDNKNDDRYLDKGKRTKWNRFMDFLMLPLYSTAGALKGAIDPNDTALHGLVSGIRAGNPFGQGYQKGEVTYSDVLGELGWQPTSTAGKITKGALGLVADVFLDPSTYLSGGTSALLKGTGKLSAVAHGAEGLAKLTEDAGKAFDISKGLTLDVAKDIVRSKGLATTETEIAKDAENVVTKFNDLLGLNPKVADQTLSLSHAPFGKKIFGSLADKSVVVTKAETLQKIGDLTLAPVYSKIRNQMLGSKFGELFIPSSKLYQASKTNPEAVFAYMKHAEVARGLFKDRVAQIAYVEKMGKDLKDLNLTPDDAKKVVELMQNKTVWDKVSQTFKFLDSAEAQNAKKLIKTNEEITRTQLDKMKSERKALDDLKYAEENNHIDQSIFDLKGALVKAEEDYTKSLLNLDVKHMSDTEHVKESIDAYQKEIERLTSSNQGQSEVMQKLQTKYDDAVHLLDEKTMDRSISVLNQYEHNTNKLKDMEDEFANAATDYSEGKITLQSEKELALQQDKLERDVIVKNHDEFKKMMSDRSAQIKENIAKQNQRKIDQLTGTAEEKRIDSLNTIKKHLLMSDSSYRSMMKQIKDKGIVSYKRERDADKFLEKYPEWSKETSTDGVIILRPPQELLASQRSSVDMVKVMDDTMSVNKVDHIRSISQYIYGDPNWISLSTYSKNIDNIVQMIKEGKSVEFIRNQMAKTPNFYSGIGDEIYRYVAFKLGYGADKTFPTWEELYDKPMKEIYERAKEVREKKHPFKAGDVAEEARYSQEHPIRDFIVDSDYRKMGELEQLNLERAYWMNKFKDAKTMDDVKKVIQTVEDTEMLQDYNKYRDLANSTEKATDKYGEDLIAERRRKDILNTDSAIHSNGKDLRTDYTDKSAPMFEDFVTHKDIFNRIINGFYLDVKPTLNKGKVVDAVQGVKSITKGQVKYANAVASEAQLILRDFFKKSYQDLTEKQIENLLLPLAFKNADARIAGKKFIWTGLNAEDADKIAKRAKERLSLQRVDAIKSQVEEGTQVTAIKDKRIMVGTVKSVETGKAGETSYTLVRPNGEEVKGIIPGEIQEVRKGQLRLSGDELLVEAQKKVQTSPITGEFVDKMNELRVVIEKNKDTLSQIDKEYGRSFKVLTERYQKLIQEAKPDMTEVLSHQQKITEAQKELIRLNREKDHTVKQFTAHYEKRVRDLQSDLEDFEINKHELNNLYNDGKIFSEEGYTSEKVQEIEDQINELTERYHEIDTLLSNDDALDSYIQTMFGSDEVTRIVKENDPRMGMLMLDTMPVSDKVKQAVTILRQEFLRMGEAEIKAGKLKPEQFEVWANEYLPHIITDEGYELVKSDKGKKLPGFGDEEFGYGRHSFNPYGKSRSIVNVKDASGEIIHHPTISQINEYFSDVLKGKNMFSEDIFQIYQTRALKHVDLIYDTKYTDEMLNLFGKEYTGTTEKGHKVVMNYGKLKEAAQHHANLNIDMQISNAVSTHITGVIQDINREVAERLGIPEILPNRFVSNDPVLNLAFKKTVSHEISKEAKAYVDENFRGGVRSKLFEDYVRGFSGERLNNLAMPMLEFDRKGVREVTDAFGGTIRDYTNHIKEKLFSSLNSFYYERFYMPMDEKVKDALAKEIRDLDLVGLRKKIDELKPSLDEVDSARLDRLLGKIDKVEKVPSLQIRQVGDAIVERANQMRKLQIYKDQRRYLQLWDKFTHLIKLNQTAVMISFHTRNMMSNAFNNWLAVGTDALNPEFQTMAWKTLKSKGDVQDVLKITAKNGTVSEMTWKELYEKAHEYEVINQGYFAKDLGQGFDDNPVANFFRNFKVPDKLNPGDTLNFIPYQLGTKAGSFVEGRDRLIHFASQVSHGMSFEEAAQSVNKYLFDYSDITAFEANVMKRIFPYYTWMRKNAVLQLDQLLEQPEKYRFVAQIETGVNSMNVDNERVNPFFVNDFALDWIQLPFSVTNPDGKQEPVLWNPNLPFLDLSRIPDPLHPLESLKQLFTQSNPLLKVPVEEVTNRNVFLDQPIVDTSTWKKDDPKLGRVAGEMKGNQLTDRLDHILSQLTPYSVAQGLINKSGTDLGLQLLNNTTGIKMLSYPYDTIKQMKIQEMIQSGKWDNRNALDKLESQLLYAIKRKLNNSPGKEILREYMTDQQMKNGDPLPDSFFDVP